MHGLARFSALLAAPALACAAPSAEVSGTVGGITFGESSNVFFGASYVVIAHSDTDCEGVSFVERNYDAGVAPTDADVQLLQFAFKGDTVEQGLVQVSLEGPVFSTVVDVTGGAFREHNATAGTLTVDEIVDEERASGTFDTVTFEEGTVSGTFTAEWCRNLK